jgi:hypothetical protein
MATLNAYFVHKFTTHMIDISAKREEIVEEIQRVARLLRVQRLSQKEFDRHRQKFCAATAAYQFGTWNKAVKSAGLEPYLPSHGEVHNKLEDSELLLEIIALHELLGKKPSSNDMACHGKYSPRPYADRWGSWTRARSAAYEKYGEPKSIAPS